MTVIIHQLRGWDHCVFRPEKPAARKVSAMVGSLEKFRDSADVMRFFFLSLHTGMKKREWGMTIHIYANIWQTEIIVYISSHIHRSSWKKNLVQRTRILYGWGTINNHFQKQEA
jgi:hypothetical protein